MYVASVKIIFGRNKVKKIALSAKLMKTISNQVLLFCVLWLMFLVFVVSLLLLLWYRYHTLKLRFFVCNGSHCSRQSESLHIGQCIVIGYHY